MKLPKNDWSLQGKRSIWVVFILLSALSILEVYSASSNMSYSSGQYWDPLVKHSSFVLAGIVAAFLLHRVEIVYIKIGLILIYLVTLFLLPLAMFGPKVNDAGRWLNVAGVTIQPSEFAKLSMVGVVAFLFATGYRKKLGHVSPGFFWAAIAVTIIPTLFIVTENFSTAIIICFAMLAMTFTARPPRKIFWSICLALFIGAGSGFLLLKTIPEDKAEWVSENTPLHRFGAWSDRVKAGGELPANPKDYNVYENLQVAHSRIAVATSGVMGRGLGNSIERDFLPQAYSDFIYAIIIEEGGLLVGIVVMILYLVLLYSSLKIAASCKTRYSRYLVTGLSIMLVTQAMVNMAVAVGAMPVTGQPLPLMSKGGTSMIVTSLYIGIIQSVSRAVDRRKEKEKLEAEVQTKALTNT